MYLFGIYQYWILFIVVFEPHVVQCCLFGKFGTECMYNCHCKEGADCNDTSGHCTTGCQHGWGGPTCQQENVVYGRVTSQKEGSFSMNSSYAVDDDMNTCSTSKSNFPGWWSLTLDHVVPITSIVIKADKSSNIQGWQVYVGLTDTPLSMDLCSTVRVSGSGTTLMCEALLQGRYVRVVNRKGPVNICELQIKVCSPYWYGDQCDRTCNCADPEEVCDSISGSCKTGCSSGWTGTGCQTACISRYGDGCKFSCGHCAGNVSCNHVTGTCPGGCEAGWTGMFCTAKCLDDKHGQNCNKTCGHCYGIDSCDVTTGSCKHGCEPGYTGQLCKDKCEPGHYGRNCSSKCGYCAADTVCDYIIGICPSGCKPGWQGVFCTQECMRGFYGSGCKSKCTNCYKNQCDGVDGTCTRGCSSGYKGHQCNIECPGGTYGINCSKSCGKCIHGDQCDVITGNCSTGCQIGYQRPLCKQLCQEGFYGANCSKCGVCAAGTTCDPFTGLCPTGCGFNFIGEKCMQVRPFTDEDGPQLAIFLGMMITTVIVIMVLVVLCLVAIWRREYLLDPADGDTSNDKSKLRKPSTIGEDAASETTVFI